MKNIDIGKILRKILIPEVKGCLISFLMIFVLTGLTQILLQLSFAFFGVTGIAVFEEQFILARDLFLLGIVYSPTGFFSGLYTSSRIEKDAKNTRALRIIFPSIAGFILYTLSAIFFEYLSISKLNIITGVLAPVSVLALTAYLGSYLKRANS